MKFVKKPVVISATKWSGTLTALRAIESMFPALRTSAITCKNNEVSYWAIQTLEGRHVVSPGDWIIEGVKKEYYPCKPDIFEMTYTPFVDPLPTEGLKSPV